MNLRPLPTTDEQKRLTILMHNSLFGYQYSSGIADGWFAICFCDENMSTDLLNEIREITGCRSLVHDDFIGHGYLKIWWQDQNLIPSVFNSLLQRQQWFRTRSVADVCFSPSRGDVAFDHRRMELKFIEQTRDILKLVPSCVGSDDFIKWQTFDVWNYETDEGKNFCQELCRLWGKPPSDHNSKDNYLLWDIFANDQPEQKKQRSEPQEEDDFICMICLVSPPDTVVNPCKHCVVCSECSERLKNTNDAETCVQCRCPITNVSSL